LSHIKFLETIDFGLSCLSISSFQLKAVNLLLTPISGTFYIFGVIISEYSNPGVQGSEASYEYIDKPISISVDNIFLGFMSEGLLFGVATSFYEVNVILVLDGVVGQLADEMLMLVKAFDILD